MKDFLESEEFYRLMQTYRHTPIAKTEEVTECYEAVKEYIKSNIEGYQPEQEETCPIPKEPEECDQCGGSGNIIINNSDGEDSFICEHCNGTGVQPEQEEKSCETCDNVYAGSPNKRCSICINENNRGNLYSQWQPKEQKKPASAEWEAREIKHKPKSHEIVAYIRNCQYGIQLALDGVETAKNLEKLNFESTCHAISRMQKHLNKLENRIKQLEDKEWK